MARELWVVEVHTGDAWHPIPISASSSSSGAAIARDDFRRNYRATNGKSPKLRVQCYAAPLPGLCRRCGCSELFACEGGCSWVDADCTLCSACAAPERAPRPRRRQPGKPHRTAARRARRRR